MRLTRTRPGQNKLLREARRAAALTARRDAAAYVELLTPVAPPADARCAACGDPLAARGSASKSKSKSKPAKNKKPPPAAAAAAEDEDEGNAPVFEESAQAWYCAACWKDLEERDDEGPAPTNAEGHDGDAPDGGARPSSSNGWDALDVSALDVSALEAAEAVRTTVDPRRGALGSRLFTAERIFQTRSAARPTVAAARRRCSRLPCPRPRRWRTCSPG